MSYLRKLVIAGSLLLVSAASLLAGDYVDPSGFSFTYPEGWLPVTKAFEGPGKDALPPELTAWIARNKIDLNRLKVILIRNGHEEFLENLNVVVEKQQMPVSESSIKKLRDTLPAQYAALGVKVEKLQTRMQQVGDRQAVVVEYQIQLPGINIPLHQKQVFLPGGGSTYIVTCTGRVDSFDNYSPTFERILASFKVPAPLPQGFDWSAIEAGALAGAGVGAIGAMIWWISRLVVARRRNSSKGRPA